MVSHDKDSKYRLSWGLNFETGGYRTGNICGLFNNNDYHKVIFKLKFISENFS